MLRNSPKVVQLARPPGFPKGVKRLATLAELRKEASRVYNVARSQWAADGARLTPDQVRALNGLLRTIREMVEGDTIDAKIKALQTQLTEIEQGRAASAGAQRAAERNLEAAPGDLPEHVDA
jgi:hypothetical protein